MTLSKSLFVLLYVFASMYCNAQEKNKRFKIHTVAFYNLENLFDTINDPLKNDEASPMMELKTNRAEIYRKKVKNMARVIADIGVSDTNNAPVIIGVAEVENRNVLDDLVNDPLLLQKNYGIVHYDSPDGRGIDVALLYQKRFFSPVNTSTHTLKIYDDTNGKRIKTRDQLLVSGKLEGDDIHVIVNHWPSRRGGEVRSRPKRVVAAKLNKQIIDSLHAIDPYAKILTMGDFNDNPTNASFKTVLNTYSKRKKVPDQGLYNPFEKQFKKQGLGSNAYRDSWSLFDQIIITKSLLEKEYTSFRYYKSGIFNKAYLTNRHGRWEGYPFRSFSDGTFSGGFSDHFPVYVFLIREISE